MNILFKSYIKWKAAKRKDKAVRRIWEAMSSITESQDDVKIDGSFFILDELHVIKRIDDKWFLYELVCNIPDVETFLHSNTNKYEIEDIGISEGILEDLKVKITTDMAVYRASYKVNDKFIGTMYHYIEIFPSIKEGEYVY